MSRSPSPEGRYCAFAVIDGVKGVEVQTDKTWAYAKEVHVPRIMVTPSSTKALDFSKALESAQRTFSRAIIPFTLPIGKEKDFRGVVDVVHLKAYELGADGQAKEIDIPSELQQLVEKTRERLVELVAESDDALMEKYFDRGHLTKQKLCPIITGHRAKQNVPVSCLKCNVVDCVPTDA